MLRKNMHSNKKYYIATGVVIMERCSKCFMPRTTPRMMFDDSGVCQGCLNYENRANVDWEMRKKELAVLCDKYRDGGGKYDCAIPVSGGKDSHRLVYEMKVNMGMNPLLITVGDIFTKTQAGIRNYQNIGKTFGCDHILFELNPELFKKVARIAFEEFGDPLRFLEAAIYTVPMKLAIKLGIPLVVFGENSAYEYGTTDKDNYCANDHIFGLFKFIDLDYWVANGIRKADMNAIIPPSPGELDQIKPEVIFMSYFCPWSSTINLEIAKRYGFSDLGTEWVREGYIENFEQIDSLAYIVHIWLKYPKFGFQRVNDLASRRVREGQMSLEQAKEAVRAGDHKLDQTALLDFVNTLGYSVKGFWDVVDSFWNRSLFEKKNNCWVRRL